VSFRWVSWEFRREFSGSFRGSFAGVSGEFRREFHREFRGSFVGSFAGSFGSFVFDAFWESAMVELHPTLRDWNPISFAVGELNTEKWPNGIHHGNDGSSLGLSPGVPWEIRGIFCWRFPGTFVGDCVGSFRGSFHGNFRVSFRGSFARSFVGSFVGVLWEFCRSFGGRVRVSSVGVP
jgi:hypothetical protein